MSTKGLTKLLSIEPSDTARLAAEEISSTFGLRLQEGTLQHAAAIISKHFAPPD